MDKITLKAEALFSGVGCPVCGNKKSESAKTCHLCRKTIGSAATKAVDNFVEAMCDALFGNAAANSGNVVRANIWGRPVLANLTLDRDTIFHPAKNDIESYWECRRSVPGRFVSVYIFGLDPDVGYGQEVCGLAELKIKNPKGAPVHYIRVQAVKGVKSDVKLAVFSQSEDERITNAGLGLPSHIFDDEKYGFAIGFLPAVKPQPVAEACAG
ncbi:MAG: hypothetical protein WCL13_03185 [bacterium]